MEEQRLHCCPYCECEGAEKNRDKEGLIEVGPLEFEESEEEVPMDIWMCPKCERRFVVMKKW